MAMAMTMTADADAGDDDVDVDVDDNDERTVGYSAHCLSWDGAQCASNMHKQIHDDTCV